MRKGIGWILRKIGEDHQLKARPFTVSKLRVPRKLYYGRLAQLHLDFTEVTERTIPNELSNSFASSESSLISASFAMDVVQFWRASIFEQPAAWSKINECVHLVDLSATFPNGVPTCLHFDASYRPCGLQQPFIEGPKTGFRALANTVKFLRDIAVETEMINRFIKADGGTREILSDEANDISKLCYGSSSGQIYNLGKGR
ncbi:hypothetical protein ARMGADRAFT_1032680 [Armillaria gallica]|uniref:Uncharacterized protein n=1 Tax=Armillaria gallica TaxID=47427 RepID=A0A2H3D4A2_ARMGA|nr:hypothetical protein ARMGADRAFT_1032680 [Armillaria gallica]